MIESEESQEEIIESNFAYNIRSRNHTCFCIIQNNQTKFTHQAMGTNELEGI